MPGRSPLDDDMDWENDPVVDTAVEDIKKRREAAAKTKDKDDGDEPKPATGRRSKKQRARRGSASADDGDGFDVSGLGIVGDEDETEAPKAKRSRKKATAKAPPEAGDDDEDRLEATLQVWHRSPGQAAKEYGVALDADGTEYYCHQRSFADRENLAELRSFVDGQSKDGGEVSLKMPISFRPGRRKRPDGRHSALEVSVTQFA